jgi:hypothetical protein
MKIIYIYNINNNIKHVLLIIINNTINNNNNKIYIY